MNTDNGKLSDVFVVNTPLQLLNAIEAKSHYRSTRVHLVILKFDRWPAEAFEKLVDRSDWTSVRSVTMQINRPSWENKAHGRLHRLAEYVWTLRRAFQRRTLENAMAKFGPIRILGVGNYCQAFMLHLLNTCDYQVGVALDDGTDSFVAVTRRQAALGQSEIQDQKIEAKARFGVMTWLKSAFESRFVRLDSRDPLANIEFFTVYDLDSPANSSTDYSIRQLAPGTPSPIRQLDAHSRQTF